MVCVGTAFIQEEPWVARDVLSYRCTLFDGEGKKIDEFNARAINFQLIHPETDELLDRWTGF